MSQSGSAVALGPAGDTREAGARASRRAQTHSPSLIDGDLPLPAALSRVRGGTFSSSVGRVRFADGTVALTDLIGLTPSVAAYSVDYFGESPEHLGHYRVEPWSAAPAAERGCEREIAWVLLNSYPTVDTAALSRELRARGHRLGRADLLDHEAIAATQAAIWHFTDGLDLDRTPRDVPRRAHVSDATGRRPHEAAASGIAPWVATVVADAPATMSLVFAESPRLDSYSFTLDAGAPDDLRVQLECSSDGRAWNPVPSSVVHPARDGRNVHDLPHARDGIQVAKGLGAGATTARTIHGRAYGYSHYRLAVTSAEPAVVVLRDLAFTLADGDRFDNPARVVHLYDHLVEGARRAAGAQTPVQGPAFAILPRQGERIGPFRVDARLVAEFTPRVEASVAGVWTVTRADGSPVTGALRAGEDFYLDGDPDASSGSVRLALDVHRGWAHAAAALVGSRRPQGLSELTTLAALVRRRTRDTVIEHVVSWRRPAVLAAAPVRAARS